MGKKKLHFFHSGQSYGGSKFNVLKNDAKVPNLNADLELGSRFGPQHQKKGRNPKKFVLSQNCDFAGLMMGPKKFQLWPESSVKKCQNAEVFVK